ncbi:MAG TPA: AI-2E family transporter [Candidatus Dormibacteraeota bacterium]|nr:AI-2E family transporter [Candidatus Dormibacteraeota bacterium]
MAIGGTRESRLVRALLVPLVILAWLGVLVGVVWLLAHVAHTILVIVLATVVAFAVAPLVRILRRFVPGPVATGVAYLITVIVVVSLLAFIVATVAAQTASLVREITVYAKETDQFEATIVSLVAPFGVTAAQVDDVRSQLVTKLEGFAGSAASGLLRYAREVVSIVADVALVLILSLYFLAGGPAVRGWLQEHVPASQRNRARIGTSIVNQVVGGYVRGTLTMAIIIGVLVGVGMGVLQVRYAVLLGVVAFFMAFVPVVGTLISGTLCVVIALFQSWPLALIVLAYFVVVHVLESYVVGPRVVGEALGIHPAIAIIALIAGTELFGFWGALFGAPLAGLVQATVVAAWREYRAGYLEVIESATKRSPA